MMANADREPPRCTMDLEETEDRGVAVTISASRYYLQWHALPTGALSSMRDLLSAPTDEHREVRLGEAFGNAEVLLVVHEQVVRLKVLRPVEGLQFSDLLEVTLSGSEIQALLDAIREAQDLWE